MQNSFPPVSLLLQNTYRPSQKTVRHAVRSVQRHSLKFTTRRHFFKTPPGSRRAPSSGCPLPAPAAAVSRARAPARAMRRPPLPSFAIWLLSVPSLPMAVLYRDATLWEPRVGRGLPYPCPLPAPAAAVSRARARPRHAPSPPCPAAARPALPLPAPRPGGRPHATPACFC